MGLEVRPCQYVSLAFDRRQNDTVIGGRHALRTALGLPSCAILLGLCAFAWHARADAEEAARVLRPRAMGAAARLVSTRSADPDAVLLDRLVVDGLELAPTEPPVPGVTSRAAATTGKVLYTSQVQTQVVHRQQAITAYQAPKASAGKVLASPPVYTTLPYPPPRIPSPAPAPAPQPAPAPGGSDFDSEKAAYELERARLQFERGQQVYEMLESRLSELKEMRARRERLAEEKEKALQDVQGPSAVRPINLLEGLRVDPGVPLYQSELLRISRNVYQDGNPESGLFYYVPHRFDLAWDPQSQYGMTVIYGMAGADEDEGEVFMAARLDAGIDLAEIEVARQLIRAYALRHSNDEAGRIRFEELRPLPLQSASEVELFGGSKHEFAIDPDAVNVRGITDLLDTLDVSWATDVRRLLNIESLLRTDAGLHGSMTFEAAASEPFSATAPIEISVAVPTTFGRIPFLRQQGWRNQTFYPIRLHAVHSLVISPAKHGFAPVVYTWRLDEAEVAPGEEVRWDASEVPEWIDRVAQLQWVAYSVENRCEPCDKRVFTERFIPAPPPTRMLMVTTGDVFEATGAERVAIFVRSPFLDPQRSSIRQQPAVQLSGDGEETAVARLFLGEREISGEGAGEPLYEYRLEVTMADGEVRRGERWLPSRELDLLVGSANLGELPALAEDPAPQRDEP